MNEIIELQLKVLRLYPAYNHQYALALNTGNALIFFRNLLKYEKKLSEKQTENIDMKLVRKYSINADNDEQWDELNDTLDTLEEVG